MTNSFRWYGSPEKDPSAVHIDILHAEVVAFHGLGNYDLKLPKSDPDTKCRFWESTCF